MEGFSKIPVTDENPGKSYKKIRNHHRIIPNWFLIDTTFNKSFLLKSIPNRLGQYLCSCSNSLFIKNNSAIMQRTMRFFIFIADPDSEQSSWNKLQIFRKIFRSHGSFLQFYHMIFSQNFFSSFGDPIKHMGIIDDRGIPLLILYLTSSSKAFCNGRPHRFQTILDQCTYTRIQGPDRPLQDHLVWNDVGGRSSCNLTNSNNAGFQRSYISGYNSLKGC